MVPTAFILEHVFEVIGVVEKLYTSISLLQVFDTKEYNRYTNKLV